jgi:TPR repeat protein
VSGTGDSALRLGLAAFEAGRIGEAYEILRPLADAGNVKAQACAGSIVFAGLHRIADPAVHGEWLESASPDQLAAEAERARQDRELAEPWLRAASEGGDGGATHNLAMMYVTGIGGEGWEDRKAYILGLLAKARAQGFHCFDDGEPPGVAYLGFLERCAALEKRWITKHPDDGQPTSRRV